MLTRFYADNFKCLQNFTLEFDRFTVLTGPNGSGKTTVLEAIRCVTDLLTQRGTIERQFPTDTLTRWDKRSEQLFELDVRLPETGTGAEALPAGLYRYRLRISHDRLRGKNRIVEEELTFESRRLYRGWFVENLRLQARGLRRFGVIALVDEDGTGPRTRPQALQDDLRRLQLPAIDPAQGRLLVLPVKNVETWMVWGARWHAVGRPVSPRPPAAFAEVDETHDYKRWRARSGEALRHEPQMEAFSLGRIIAELNPATPPSGVPPALAAVLRPWSDFLEWARLE